MERKETIRLAIQAEIKSQNLYKALAKSFTNPETSTLFQQLVPMEVLHEEKLRLIYAKEFPDSTLELDENLTPDLKGIKIREAKNVLEYAISREEIAHDIYLALADDTNDAELKNLLYQFAQEELDHKTILFTEIQRLQGMMQWYDPSELNGFVED